MSLIFQQGSWKLKIWSKMLKMAALVTWKLGSGLACSQGGFEKFCKYSEFWVDSVRKICHQICFGTTSSWCKSSLKIDFNSKTAEKYDLCDLPKNETCCKVFIIIHGMYLIMILVLAKLHNHPSISGQSRG